MIKDSEKKIQEHLEQIEIDKKAAAAKYEE